MLIQILTCSSRRRKWSDCDKAQIIDETSEPGASESNVDTCGGRPEVSAPAVIACMSRDGERGRDAGCSAKILGRAG